MRPWLWQSFTLVQPSCKKKKGDEEVETTAVLVLLVLLVLVLVLELLELLDDSLIQRS